VLPTPLPLIFQQLALMTSQAAGNTSNPVNVVVR
jgi:hypothetical protein